MINRIKTDTFFRRYAIYFSGSMVVAFFNYIFHPILGRILPPADFGDIQALISLITQSALIFGAFSMIAINVTANTEDVRERNAIISELQKIVFWIIGVILIIFLLSITKLKIFFNFSSIYPLASLILILPISAAMTFRNAFLQGKGRFAELSLSGIMASFGRILFATIFVFLGWKAFGASFGIVLANICALIFLLMITKKSLKTSLDADLHILEKGSVKKELQYGFLVFCATGIITLLYTSDVLIVKHYFNAADAGLYSGISAIAKILFFLIAPSSAVLLSTVKMRGSFTENSSALKKSLLISVLVGICGLFTFWIFNDMIIGLMMGERYVPFAGFLPKAGLVMLLAAIANVLVYYFLALRKFFLVVISAVGSALLGFVIFWGHSNIASILNGLLISLAVIITLLSISYAKDYFHNRAGIQRREEHSFN